MKDTVNTRNWNHDNKNNKQNDDEKQSRASRRVQRRKMNKKINRYCLITINDKMDEIYDSMHRINTALKQNVIDIFKPDVIEEKESVENRQLYIQGFDIMDKNCHKNMTDLLLRFGPLSEDIIINFDKNRNPFCKAHFKKIEDAKGVQQTRKLKFGDHILRIRYSTQKK